MRGAIGDTTVSSAVPPGEGGAADLGALNTEISDRRRRERDRCLAGAPHTTVSRLNLELLSLAEGRLRASIQGGEPTITVRRELSPSGAIFRAQGPDGHRFSYFDLASLRERLAMRYGPHELCLTAGAPA
jgi:hypothetical protein